MIQAVARRTLFVISTGLFMVWALAQPARAADLDYTADYLNRQQANLSSGLVHDIFFTPVTNLPGNLNILRLTFNDNPDGKWCRTAGNLTVTGLTTHDGTTEAATALPGGLVANCVQGSGSGSSDSITVSNVGPLLAGTEYGVRVGDGATGTLGTPPAQQSIPMTLATNNGSSDVDSLLFYQSILSTDNFVVSATVVATIPPSPQNPSVEFRGLGAPIGDITITRDGIAVQTVPTSSDAAFDVTIADQPVGQHLFTVTGHDRDGGGLTALSFALNLTTGSASFVSGIFLGPSITINKTTVKLGQLVTVSGHTAPDSTLTVLVDALHALNLITTADGAGRWSAAINTREVGLGRHAVKARAVSGGSLTSEYSRALNFIVISAGPSPKNGSTPGPVVISPADLNHDGHVNIIDFSIFLYYWLQQNPINIDVDLNHDSFVNMADFSIILFQWTG